VIEKPNPRIFGRAPGTVVLLATDESGAYDRSRLYHVGTTFLFTSSSEDGQYQDPVSKREAIEILKRWYSAQVRGERSHMSDDYDGRFAYVFEPEAFPLIAAAYGVPVSEVETGRFVPTESRARRAPACRCPPKRKPSARKR
jgi:hypothetical protein